MISGKSVPEGDPAFSVDIEAILAPFLPAAGLTTLQREQVRAYLDLLLKWNQKINLTSLRQPDEVLRRHFGESFFLAAALTEEKPHGRLNGALGRLVDVGSGAGFPGIPVKIYLPQLSATLIESQNKKATFLKEVIRNLKLINVDVFQGRAQDWARSASHRGEIVTLRAVEHFEEALAAAANLVAADGQLALLIGAKQVDVARRLSPAFAWESPRLLPLSDSRVLLVGHRSAGEEAGV